MNKLKLNLKILKNKENKILLFIIVFFAIIYAISSTTIKWLFFTIISSSTTLFIGIFLAWILNPLVKKIMQIFKLKSRKFISVLLVLLLIAIFQIILILLSTPILHQTRTFIAQINSYRFVERMGQFFNSLFSYNNGIQIVTDIRTSIIDYFTKNLTSYIALTIKYFVQILLLAMTSIAIATYLLIDYKRYSNKFINLLSSSHGKNNIISLFEKIHQVLVKWIHGWLIDQSFIFTFTATLLFFTGVEAWLILALIMTILNFVPFIGPILGGLIILSFTTVMYLGAGTINVAGLYTIDSNLLVLLVNAGIIIIQTLESVILIPKIYSTQLKLRPVTILVGLGFIGGLISPFFTPLTIPILGIIKAVYTHFTNKKLDI